MNALTSDNPFSTCFTRPGKIPYLLPDSEDQGDAKTNLRSLIARFTDRCVGQIVGPHGCGKTTLCHMLANELSDRFPTVDYVTIRSGRDVETTRYRNSFEADSEVAAGAKLTIVDGAERVSLLQQRMIAANLLGRVKARLSRPQSEGSNPDGPGSKSSGEKRFSLTPSLTNGLLFTSHRPLKFIPILFSITPSLATFIRVAKYLDSSLKLTDGQLAKLYEQADHNIREAIMLLYDWHESVESY